MVLLLQLTGYKLGSVDAGCWGNSRQDSHITSWVKLVQVVTIHITKCMRFNSLHYTSLITTVLPTYIHTVWPTSHLTLLVKLSSWPSSSCSHSQSPVAGAPPSTPFHSMLLVRPHALAAQAKRYDLRQDSWPGSGKK